MFWISSVFNHLLPCCVKITKMLSGLSSLLFGGAWKDDAAADQIPANPPPPPPLTTQDDDLGWVLVHTEDEGSAPQAECGPAERGSNPCQVPAPAGQAVGEEIESEEGEEMDASHLKENGDPATPSTVRQKGARRVAATVLQQQQNKQLHLQQQKRRAATGKKLSKKHLERSNAAFLVQSSNQKLTSAQLRALRPCGSMSSRHSQRSQ